MRTYEVTGLGPDGKDAYSVLELPARRAPYDAREIAFMDSGACRAHDPRIWDTNTNKGQTTLRGSVRIDGKTLLKQDVVALARRICAECPVIADCLQFITRYPEDEGIWAGLIPEERAP
jgi:hypothetical protein